MGTAKRSDSAKGAAAGRRIPRFHRDMLVADALETDPAVREVLASFGLPCDRCVVADHETLAEGCTPLGLEVERIVARLNTIGKD